MKCEYCGTQTDERICPSCGAVLNQPEPPAGTPPTGQPAQPTVVINNYTQAPPPYMGQQQEPAQAANTPNTAKSKWTAFFLCLFLGYFGAHKFYEGKVGMGILYIFTIGLFCIGWIADIVALLAKPDPYYV